LRGRGRLMGGRFRGKSWVERDFYSFKVVDGTLSRGLMELFRRG